MKKILVRVVIGLIIVLIVAVLAVSLFLDGAVKRAVETFGPKITKVDVKLDSVHLSLLSGSGKIKGLVVGNPPDYKTPEAIQVGSASLALKPASIFGSKIVITSIAVENPEITFEGGLGGNNLSKILANVDETTGGGKENAGKENAKAPEQGPGKKLEVDDFLIKGAKLHVSVTGMRGQAVPVVLPDIHLTGLGTGPDGITAAELTKRVLQQLKEAAEKAAATAVSDLGKDATGAIKGLENNAATNIGGVTKGIGNLFKKK